MADILLERDLPPAECTTYKWRHLPDVGQDGNRPWPATAQGPADRLPTKVANLPPHSASRKRRPLAPGGFRVVAAADFGNRPQVCQPAPHSGKPQTALAFLRHCMRCRQADCQSAAGCQPAPHRFSNLLAMV